MSSLKHLYFAPLPTGIETLDDLLAPPPPDPASSAASPAKTIKPKPAGSPGFAHHPKKGFFGVVFGASNSGKSVLALQLACRFVRSEDQEKESTAAEPQADKGERKAKKTATLHARHAVFFTQEPAVTVCERAVHGFAFLGEHQIATDLNQLDPDGAGPGRLTIVEMPLDAEKQRRCLVDAFEIINSRFCCKKDDHQGQPGRDNKLRVLVVMDNAETVRQETFLEIMGEMREGARLPDPDPEAHRQQFFKRLRAYCLRHRLRSWFTFEEQPSQAATLEDTHIATARETYAADAVIRLGMVLMNGNFRERSIEIVKARDQFYRRGRHHFAIRGYVPKERDKAEWHLFGGPSATSDPRQTGIVVFPSLPTQLHRMSREYTKPGDTKPRDRSRLGIEEVDAAVRFANRPGFMSTAPLAVKERQPSITEKHPGYLCPATVSVLVCDLDSMATDVALHFVAQPPHGAEGEHPWIYISFHHESHMLRKIASGYPATEKCQEHLRDIITASAAQRLQMTANLGECIFLPPEHISDSKLIEDITRRIKEKKKAHQRKGPLRVVVDDLFALDKRFTLLRDKDAFIAALFHVFRSHGVISLVLDTVEVGEGRNPLEKSIPAGMGDHVFLLRHIEFQNRTRKVFSVLKLAEFIEPTHFWDLSKNGAGGPLVANSKKFQFYKGLLSGRPEPVKIALSLYADSRGSPRDLNLGAQQAILSKTFGQNIEIQACHPGDYEVLQQTVGQKPLPVLGDCHIISVDEIWLHSLIGARLLRGFEHGDSQNEFHWDKSHYVTTAHDLACEAHKNNLPARRHHFAIPERHNCGVLAYYPALARTLKDADKLKTLPPRCPTWKDLEKLQAAFVRQYYTRAKLEPRMLSYREREPTEQLLAEQRLHGRQPACLDNVRGAFTFSMENRESCVSFLLELVLSFLKEGDELVDAHGRLRWEFPPPRKAGKPGQKRQPWVDALLRLLALLDPWDIQRLADNWLRSCPEERPCLYSRQWFTSWGALGLRFPGLKVLELPRGERGSPTPVSGTWYLAMLADSSAVSAGKALIQRLTSPEDELHRFNSGIGMPVSRELYAMAAPGPSTPSVLPDEIALLQSLPYAKQLAKLPGELDKLRKASETRACTENAKACAEKARLALITVIQENRNAVRAGASPDKAVLLARKERAAEAADTAIATAITSASANRLAALAARAVPDAPADGRFFHHVLRKSTCPFYRTSIAHYATVVSPILMGLMVGAARLALDPDPLVEEWTFNKREGRCPVEKRLRSLVEDAQAQLTKLLDQRKNLPS